MAKKKLQHVNRRLTDEERARHTRIRQAAIKDIPPKRAGGRKPSPPGIPARIRQARELQGLTWYALARQAAIPIKPRSATSSKAKMSSFPTCRPSPPRWASNWSSSKWRRINR